MGKFPVQLGASNKDFLFGFKSFHVCFLVTLPCNILEAPEISPETEILRHQESQTSFGVTAPRGEYSEMFQGSTNFSCLYFCCPRGSESV